MKKRLCAGALLAAFTVFLCLQPAAVAQKDMPAGTVAVSYTHLDVYKRQSWAFQVESPLTVVSSTPADNTWGMPASTGIQFCFSQVVSSIDPAQLEITRCV